MKDKLAQPSGYLNVSKKSSGLRKKSNKNQSLHDFLGVKESEDIQLALALSISEVADDVDSEILNGDSCMIDGSAIPEQDLAELTKLRLELGEIISRESELRSKEKKIRQQIRKLSKKVNVSSSRQEFLVEQYDSVETILKQLFTSSLPQVNILRSLKPAPLRLKLASHEQSCSIWALSSLPYGFEELHEKVKVVESRDARLEVIYESPVVSNDIVLEYKADYDGNSADSSTNDITTYASKPQPSMLSQLLNEIDDQPSISFEATDESYKSDVRIDFSLPPSSLPVRVKDDHEETRNPIPSELLSAWIEESRAAGLSAAVDHDLEQWINRFGSELGIFILRADIGTSSSPRDGNIKLDDVLFVQEHLLLRLQSELAVEDTTLGCGDVKKLCFFSRLLNALMHLAQPVLSAEPDDCLNADPAITNSTYVSTATICATTASKLSENNTSGVEVGSSFCLDLGIAIPDSPFIKSNCEVNDKFYLPNSNYILPLVESSLPLQDSVDPYQDDSLIEESDVDLNFNSSNCIGHGVLVGGSSFAAYDIDPLCKATDEYDAIAVTSISNANSTFVDGAAEGCYWETSIKDDSIKSIVGGLNYNDPMSDNWHCECVGKDSAEDSETSLKIPSQIKVKNEVGSSSPMACVPPPSLLLGETGAAVKSPYSPSWEPSLLVCDNNRRTFSSTIDLKVSANDLYSKLASNANSLVHLSPSVVDLTSDESPLLKNVFSPKPQEASLGVIMDSSLSSPSPPLLPPTHPQPRPQSQPQSLSLIQALTINSKALTMESPARAILTTGIAPSVRTIFNKESSAPTRVEKNQPLLLDHILESESEPDFKSFTLNQLKQCCAQYGLKKMESASKMSAILLAMWRQMHSTPSSIACTSSIGFSSATSAQLSKTIGAAVEVVGDENRELNPRKRKALSSLSSSSSLSASSSSLLAAPIIDSVGVSDGALRRSVESALRSSKELYEKILLFEPIELEEAQNRIQIQGIKISRVNLLKCLDDLCIFVSAGKS